MNRIVLALAGMLVFMAPAQQPGQERLEDLRRPPALRKQAAVEGPAEFTFVRTIYASPFRGRGWGWGSWATDFPEADFHFIAGIRYWSGTNLNISSKPEQLGILDDRLFSYPLIYFVEPGYMDLTDEEAARLAEYSARGGFLFLDDFWGEYEWDNVREQLRRIFPGRQIEDLPLSHPVFHSYFDIEEVVQVPGIGAWLRRGITHEKGGVVPHYMGIQDDKDRLLAFVARNCDLGDAWEWIDDSRYPMKYGLAAYRVGVNVIMYAMSH
jgi:hypothetical protein